METRRTPEGRPAATSSRCSAASPALCLLGPCQRRGPMEAGRRAEEGPGEDGFSSRLLEDVKQRLRQAFQRARRASPPRRARPVASRGAGGRRAAAAQDELRRAHVEGAIAWLRVELLEMKSQNRKLAKTLLDLSVEIQRLRNETDMSAALESKPSIMASPE
ncbi:alanine and arginine-rich domain-containing protein-like [Varanus komodoensis]|uniref:alanine and arginine-rich domain-containing protein-like n=1 Tax=Varanus komodoensis TaxID=61221 RepID=UPI001CF7BE85|nr:alanine and arginine-rich domain-containing protein-like [Varanus komodoensis]